MLAAAKRRARAVERGYFVDVSPIPRSAVLVQKVVAADVRHFLQGMLLHVVRDAANGHPSHSTRSASLKAFRTGLIDSAQLVVGSKIAKLENRASIARPRSRCSPRSSRRFWRVWCLAPSAASLVGGLRH